jgi:hypothetical protein
VADFGEAADCAVAFVDADVVAADAVLVASGVPVERDVWPATGKELRMRTVANFQPIDETYFI